MSTLNDLSDVFGERAEACIESAFIVGCVSQIFRGIGDSFHPGLLAVFEFLKVRSATERAVDVRDHREVFHKIPDNLSPKHRS